MCSKKVILITTAIYCSIPILLLMTSPDSLPLPLLTLPFLLLFAALYMTCSIILKRYFSHLGQSVRRGVSAGLASLPVLLLILQSIGQLTVRDALITIGLIVILIVYFRKTDFLH